MRNTSLNFLFAVLLLVAISSKADSCLGKINASLGANPSFFNVSDPASQEICSMNISDAEKFYLLVHNTFSESPFLPSIRSYNALLPFSCPPNGTEITDKSYIHNAWVRAITVMPSVMDEDGNYWAPQNGEVLAKHSYYIKLPRSASNVYPDCGTVYTLLSSEEKFSVYANGEYIGNSDMTNYATNSTNLTAKAQLSISASVRKDYYVSDCYCCKSGKDGCEETCCSCSFSNSEVENENVNAGSSLARKVYHFGALPNLTMLQCPAGVFGTAAGNFSLNTSVPVGSVFISFGHANISLRVQNLDLRTVLRPHNVLEAQSVTDGYEFSEGMLVNAFNVSQGFIQLNFSGVPPNAGESYAQLMVTDLFGVGHNMSNYTPIACPLNPRIEISMPHWVEKGSDFQVTVHLSEEGRGMAGKSVTLYYSGASYTGMTGQEGEAVFHLKANQSLVEAVSSYDGRYASAYTRGIIAVYESSEISLLISFLAFLFILVLSYTALRYMGGEL